jgi:hypothetical protein
VDIGILFDGSILARNVVFEDPDSIDTEIEGIVTKTTNLGVQQFDIVIQTMSSSVSGLSIGQPITVQFSTAPLPPFSVDLVHADSFQVSTSGFLFTAPVDLSVGQQVSIRRNSTSTASLIKADRVLLRSTRVTANVQSAPPLIFLSPLPSLFSGHGITGITAQVSVNPPTIYFQVGKIINSSNVVIGVPVSARGPLFIVGSGRTLIATKIVVK